MQHDTMLVKLGEMDMPVELQGYAAKALLAKGQPLKGSSQHRQSS